MQKKFYSKVLFLFALLLTVSTSVWADNILYYTLDGTQTGGNSGYADESEITQNGMTWKVTGNTTMNPWRIGGKSLTNQDRPVYSTTATNEVTSQIDVTLGTSNLTALNSVTLIVASDADFSTVIDTKTINTPAAQTTLSFTPSTGVTWVSGSYIKLVFNVTVSDTKNKFVQLTKIELYKDESSTSTTTSTPMISGTTPFLGSTEVTITCSTDGASIYYTLNGDEPTTASTAYTGPFTINETATVKAIAESTLGTSSVASKTFTAVTPYTTLGELTGLANNTTFGVTGELLVVAKPTTKHAYVQDDEGDALIYDATGEKLVNLEVGKTIAANWIGSVSIYNQLFEMVPNAVLAAGTAAAVDVTYPDAEIASVTAENVNKVVTLKGVTYTLGEGKNFTINKGDDSVAGYNQFNLTLAAAEDGKTYDIVGAIGRYNANIQFQPINIAESSSATGIDSMDSETEATTDSEAYNLAGQRVDKNFKGIVVMNGKKLLKK